ncbi:OmpA family protein [Myxococcota bacterium]
MLDIRISVPILLLGSVLLSACSSAPRPQVLVHVDQQMADKALMSRAAALGAGNFANAKKYHQQANQAYEDGDQEWVENHAQIAKTYLEAALEEVRTADARERIMQAEQRQVDAGRAKQEDEALKAKLDKRIARMEKILALEGKLDSQAKASKREKKKLTAEIEKAKKDKELQLKLEKQESEVRALLTSVKAKVQTAEALEAQTFDAANLKSAKDNLMQAERALNGKDFDTARKVIETADKAATTAIDTARTQYAAKTEELNVLEDRKNLLEEVTAVGASDAKQDERGVVLTLHGMFEPGKPEVKVDKEFLIKRVAEIARKYEGYPVIIEGHTDSRGRQADNLSLSTSRAQAFTDYLVQKEKLDLNRVKATGYGEQKPISDNSSSDGRAKNRRIEVVFLFR